MNIEKKNSLIEMTNKEFDKFMCEKFPELFRDRNKPMSQTCMCWGFDLNGPGWNHLLYNLCEKLDFVRQQTGIITVFDQIKEKFGGGRFYYHIDTENCKLEDSIIKIWCSFIDNAIDKAEWESNQTCATCGKQYWHDKITIGKWVYDTCKDCFKRENTCKDIVVTLENIEKRKDRCDILKDQIEHIDDETLNRVENFFKEIKN